jgi:deoxycytidylate deaminase
MSKKDKSYLSFARYCATKSNSRKTHGAVIVKGGRVLGTGFNKDRNDPSVVSPEHIKEHCSFHAEEVAIKEAGQDNLRNAVIYVARINRQGLDRDSKPCSRCNALIKRVGIKRVIFTAEIGEINVS